MPFQNSKFISIRRLISSNTQNHGSIVHFVMRKRRAKIIQLSAPIPGNFVLSLVLLEAATQVNVAWRWKALDHLYPQQQCNHFLDWLDPFPVTWTCSDLNIPENQTRSQWGSALPKMRETPPMIGLLVQSLLNCLDLCGKFKASWKLEHTRDGRPFQRGGISSDGWSEQWFRLFDRILHAQCRRRFHFLGIVGCPL